MAFLVFADGAERAAEREVARVSEPSPIILHDDSQPLGPLFALLLLVIATVLGRRAYLRALR